MSAVPVSLQVVTRLDPGDIELIVAGVTQRLREMPAGWSVREFAAHIKRDPSYVHREIREGRLKAIRLGGKGDRLITTQAALEWMAGPK